ncbi:VTT domain-containing protein [Leclercia sp. LTM01]|uniref:TVP38/TMEM64 family membrane protein n=1 Tax=Leclercia barmai TaxID=2785629 RepID=A0ABS7RVR7_9ENTR|nr:MULTISPECIES: VTT domain-containing protein [unclassified Leclercia]MBZ0057499.1 TVP38/TMEM64 family protein [Leclercia sp. EMC7]MCM5695662.1 VTT domain-containing protein [Leclercia sp. LTM01]MCM5700071.1 VTT domain-containing protein [Leclercia sp. LTM14]
MRIHRGKFLLICALLGAFSIIFTQLPPGTLTLENLQAQHQALRLYCQQAPLKSAALFFIVYVLVTTLSLPGAALLTLLGGALFGLWPGIVLVSFASTLGATLAMLTSRYLLRDWVQRRFAGPMRTVNQGVSRDGAFYLFALRLVPLFPFFVVNLLAGVTTLGVRRYWWVSQLGMLPGAIVYLNAGHQLGQIASLRDILSPGVVFAFTLLGLLPLITRWLLARFSRTSP